MKRWAMGLGVVAVVACSGWVGWPSPIDAVALDVAAHDGSRWSPEPWFTDALRIELPDGHGPEDIEVDEAGRIYAGLADGRILRWDDPTAAPITLTNTGGRPLGLHWAPSGELWVADAVAGLLAVNPGTGEWRTLTRTCGGQPLVFTDDLEIGRDGTAWFSDASQRFGVANWKHDILELGATGRLCRFKEGWDEAAQVQGGLMFANGVALDPSERFVLVVETSAHRVMRLWIAGSRRGEREVLIDDLPGYPDGISTGTDGVFWLAIASPRKPELDALGPYPWVRELLTKVPELLQPAPARTARVIGIDADGTVVHDHLDPRGESFKVVTSVQERAGHLWLGSLSDDALVRAPRP
jgi:sugar lactone lactonase YvrE